MNPLVVVILIAAVACAFALVASALTRDHSWVDRLWSILPVVYCGVFAGAAGFADTRLNVMAVLVLLWGVRLTANFARKGGYTGTEDYRWAVLRQRMSAGQFLLFNLFFIVLYQNVILVLITFPALTALENRGTPFGVPDVIASVAFLAFLILETVADEQQWRFHQRKKSGQPVERPFLTSGLWKFSRHPNFFFEQAQWWTLFSFGAIAAGSVVQWTVLGAFLLTLLFVGSTIFTESITASKYPAYAEYRARTSPIVPWFPRGHARRDPVAEPSQHGESADDAVRAVE